MIASLKQEVAKHGDKAAVVPIHRLEEIRQDIENMKSGEDLNKFQQYIANTLYMLDVPECGFEVRSIIITATPSPATITLVFTQQGKPIPLKLPASYADKERTPRRIEDYLNAFLNPDGFHAQFAPQLPRKRLAVRSGLARYGRNNICYVEEMGSFLNLTTLFSDVPREEDQWQEVRQMDLCQTCHACLDNCPTRAILPDRFLINNERCLPYFNEAGSEWNFPDWIDSSSHNAVYGCLRCQVVCPMNRPYMNTADKWVEFTEDETALLLERKPFAEFPQALKQKVEALEMVEYLGALPRNLRVLFENAAKN